MVWLLKVGGGVIPTSVSLFLRSSHELSVSEAKHCSYLSWRGAFNSHQPHMALRSEHLPPPHVPAPR